MVEIIDWKQLFFSKNKEDKRNFIEFSDLLKVSGKDKLFWTSDNLLNSSNWSKVMLLPEEQNDEDGYDYYFCIDMCGRWALYRKKK